MGVYSFFGIVEPERKEEKNRKSERESERVKLIKTAFDCNFGGICKPNGGERATQKEINKKQNKLTVNDKASHHESFSVCVCVRVFICLCVYVHVCVCVSLVSAAV